MISNPDSGMSLGAYRRDVRKVSQAAAAAENGIRSKGYWSRIENGREPAGVKLAIRIQEWSGGVVPAASLNPEAGALIQAAANAATGAPS